MRAIVAYGSNLVTGVTSVGPDVFDAVVLTGFTNNATLGQYSIFTHLFSPRN